MERAKTEVEKKVSRLIKFIQTKNKIPKDSKRELLGIANDLQEQCQSLFSTFLDFQQDLDPKSGGGRKGKSHIASSSSDLEYYSSEEIENVVVEEGSDISELQSKLEALRNEAEEKERELTLRVKELEQELGNAKAECDRKGDLEKEIAMKASESKQLGEKNKGLRSQISGLESVLREKGDEISTLVNKFGNSELGLTSRIEDLKCQMRNLEQEIGFLRARNAELAGTLEAKRVEEKEHVNDLMDQVIGMKHELESLRRQKDESETKLEKKVEEVTETEMQLKSLKEETEEERNRLNEEIDHLRGENQKLHTRITELDSIHKEMLRRQKDESETKLEKKVEEVTEMEMQLKSLKEEAEEERNRLNEEIDHLRGENQKLQTRITELDSLHTEMLRREKDESETNLEKKVEEVTETEMQLKSLKEETEEERNRLNEEIDHLRGENQKLQTKITELDSLHTEMKTKSADEMEDASKKLDIQVSDNNKLVKEQDDIIRRLSAKIKDQQRLLKEQKDTIDKFSDDQKQLKRWSFGSSRDAKLNPNALEKKMEELADDFKMKIEDHIRILYRRIHVAEQIHLESKNDYIKTLDTVQENRENKESLVLFETQFKKMKDVLEKGIGRSETAMKKLEEAEEDTHRVARVAKEMESAKLWVREKKSEIETLTAKLECSEAQETLLKEKLSKLEQKLSEEGTEKLSLTKVLSRFESRMKELEIKLKGREVELLSLGEEKREAIRQLCILVDYQRERYNQLKKSILKT